MKEKALITLCLSGMVVLCLCCVWMFFYFKGREKRLCGRLQEMLDEVLDGTFEDRQLDETPVSAVENSMWRYLCDSQTAYREMVQQKENVQRLISDIAHQAATPVSNIMLYAQLLTEQLAGKEDDPEAAQVIQIIVGQIEELDFLIRSLVKLSRLESGIISVRPKLQGIGSILDALRQQFELKASAGKLRFEVEDSSQQAVFDRKWTIEAMANIVDNAMKYTPQGGAVAVRVRSYTMFLCIDVTDTGIGIPEEEQGSIFTRFYRTAAAGGERGVGIGLYLAREVAKAQNGYIKVSSVVGQGSTFSFFLQK